MKIFTLILLLTLVSGVFAQEPDSVRKDSLKIYYDIQEMAKKRKATYWIYKAIFKDPASITSEKVEQKQKKEKNKYDPYKNKIIRKISVNSLDPFGTKLNDTIADTNNPIEKFGNRLHAATKPFAVRDNLLFSSGDRIDPLKMKESERILRQLVYIREAKIDVYPVSGTDSADVVVAVQDVWSLKGSVSAGTSRSSVSINERNFFGTGHDLNNKFNFNFKEKPAFFVTGSYTVPNVSHSFVSSNIYYNTYSLNKYLGLNLQRPFYSSITKWAGGLNVMKNSTKLPVYLEDGELTYDDLKFGFEDVWIGRSFPFKKGDSDEDRSSRIVLAARVMNSRFLERPSDTYLQQIYQNSTLILASIGLNVRTYYKDWNIYKFSQTEDVPEGRLIELTAGVQKREMADRTYIGMELSSGSHINNFGYLSRSIQVGSFLNFSEAEEGTVKMELSYFTDLMDISTWSLRQFIRYRLTHGFNWLPHVKVNINEEHGLFGFNSPVLLGNTKMVLNGETVIYLPYTVLGFQFAPILSAGFGLIGDEKSPLLKSKLYQFYGFGLLIRNELLVSNNFQVSIGFYPDIPGVAKSKIKFNPISNYNYNFRDFYLTQPGVVPYN